jgi:predicted transport protein
LSVGRKRITEHERDTIKEFNNLIKEHSLDAVKNIVKISNRAMDENVRLKANVWIAEKLVGKSYSIADVEGNVQDKDINIVLNVKNATTNDSESWNDDSSELDNWGEDDIYK